MPNKDQKPMQLYTLEDIAEMLKIRPRTVYKHISIGVLVGIKLGNKWRFTEEQIKEYLYKLTKKATSNLSEEKEEQAEVVFIEPPKRY